MNDIHPKAGRNKVFISYSHKDKKWLDRLQTTLMPLIRKEAISFWADNKIDPGAKWQDEIANALKSAKVAVLLVSQSFLASDFIAEHELPPLLDAAEKEGIAVLWIAVSAALYDETDIAKYQAANNPSIPLDSLKGSALNKELVSIAKKIKSAAKYPDSEISRSARRGIEELINLKDNPVVRINVGRFSGVFESSSKQIDALALYKDLHDLLHTLQFKCYNYITGIVRNAQKPDDASIWDNVFEYELTLQDIVEDLNELANQEASAQTTISWIQFLLDHLNRLFEAVRNCDIQQINIALVPIKRILSREPVELNIRLNEAARALPLPALVSALTGIYGKLDPAQITPDTLTKLKDGVDALSKLSAKLNSLIDEHDKLQWIDTELRRIEDLSRQDLSDLIVSWPYLKEKTQPCCNEVIQIWARSLMEDMGKLEEAIAAQDPNKIRQYFGRYRARINNRFYDVDLTLKKLCGELRRVGEPLSTVLEIIQ